MPEVRVPPIQEAVCVRNDQHRARVAFVLPNCTHYTQGLFEILAAKYDADFFFFSDGKDWYWERRNGSRGGSFRHEYLAGFRIGHVRIAPSLPLRLLRGDYDAIVAAIDGRFSLPIAIACARAKGIPFVLWTGIWNRIGTFFHRTILPITRYVYRNAAGVVVYGEHVSSYLQLEGVKSDRIFVAPHAVDNAATSEPVSSEETGSLRDALKMSESSAFLLFVGRLEPVKGVSHLLEAMLRVRDRNVVLVIVGEGSERKNLERSVAQLKLTSRVRFVGYVPSSEMRVYYAAALGLVLPSVTTRREKETWGLVVNEAMNQGLPVIVSDAVGAAAGGLVRNGVNGFVVPEKDPTTLANAIETFCRNPQLRKTMSEAARGIISGWDHERMAAGFENCLCYVLHAKQSKRANQVGDAVQAHAGDLS